MISVLGTLSIDQVDSLPYNRPGVYLLRNSQEQPLYVGSSINVGYRVLTHLRKWKSAGREPVEFINCEMSDDIYEAQTREIQLIKELKPLYNIKSLRHRARSERSPDVVFLRNEEEGPCLQKPTVAMEGHLASLGRKKDRWCIVLPVNVSIHLGKRTRYTITFTPTGSINPVRVLEATI